MENKIADLLKTSAFFQSFSNDSLDRLAKNSNVLDIHKHKILFVNEESANRFYIIKNGWIKLYRETIDGAQSVIDILTTGHVFGETAIFQENTYPFTAEAAENATLVSLPLSILNTEIENNSKFAMCMMTSMARYRKQQDQELENRTLKNAPQRIGCFLLRLIDQNQTGSITIKLPYDKTLIASRLGMQPETFSRALNKLKNQIDIKINGSELYISNVTQLVDYACSACSSEFPCNDIHN